MRTYGQYAIRVIVNSSRQTIWGVTLPKDVATKFDGVKMTVSVSGDQIILTSGIDIQQLKRDVEKQVIQF